MTTFKEYNELNETDLASSVKKQLEKLVKDIEKKSGAGKTTKGAEAFNSARSLVNLSGGDIDSLFMDASSARELEKLAKEYAEDDYGLQDMKDGFDWSDNEIEEFTDLLYTMSNDGQGVWDEMHPDYTASDIVYKINKLISEI